MFRIGHRSKPRKSLPGGRVCGRQVILSVSARPSARRFAPERALSPLTEPSADVEFVVRRREAQSREPKEAAGSDALRRRAEADGGATATAAKRADAPATPQPSSMTEVRWFTVRAEHYDQFKKELAAEAAIDSERPIGSMT